MPEREVSNYEKLCEFWRERFLQMNLQELKEKIPGLREDEELSLIHIYFNVVSSVSILAVFVIILFVFKSISLPVILVLVIEGAIFINMGIPYLTGTELPFIASIVIGTIQLGATVDYAILMTSRYEKERGEGKSKRESIQIAHQSSMRPVMVSAFSFFAATFGVGIYSKIDTVSYTHLDVYKRQAIA